MKPSSSEMKVAIILVAAVTAWALFDAARVLYNCPAEKAIARGLTGLECVAR